MSRPLVCLARLALIGCVSGPNRSVPHPFEGESGVVPHGLTGTPNDAPICTTAGPSTDRLWPPNHKLATVSVQGVTDPNGDPITITITAITQDEPVNGLGDGDTAPDGFGVETSQAQLRKNDPGPGMVGCIRCRSKPAMAREDCAQDVSRWMCPMLKGNSPRRSTMDRTTIPRRRHRPLVGLHTGTVSGATRGVSSIPSRWLAQVFAVLVLTGLLSGISTLSTAGGIEFRETDTLPHVENILFSPSSVASCHGMAGCFASIGRLTPCSGPYRLWHRPRADHDREHVQSAAEVTRRVHCPPPPTLFQQVRPFRRGTCLHGPTRQN